MNPLRILNKLDTDKGYMYLSLSIIATLVLLIIVSPDFIEDLSDEAGTISKLELLLESLKATLLLGILYFIFLAIKRIDGQFERPLRIIGAGIFILMIDSVTKILTGFQIHIVYQFLTGAGQQIFAYFLRISGLCFLLWGSMVLAHLRLNRNQPDH